MCVWCPGDRVTKRRSSLVSWLERMYSGLVGGLPLVGRAAWLACVDGLAFIVRVCAFGGFQL